MKAVETFDLTKRFKVKQLKLTSVESMIRSMKALLKHEGKETITAVDHVNLEINKGELFGLLGPNGAGKTTLIKLLCTVLKPDEGTARVDGHDILRERQEALTSISLVTSIDWLGYDYAMSVRENLEFYAALHGFQPRAFKDRIDESLAVVGLSEKGDVKPFTLSSGQRQRMMIARSLLIRTPIFFMDEPTVTLDPDAAANVRAFIRDELNEKMGQTIVLTTHLMHEAEALCGRIAIMNNGRIIVCDTPQNLKRKMAGEEVIEIHASNIGTEVAERLSRLDVVNRASAAIEDPMMGLGLVRIHTRDSRTVLPKILEAVDVAGVKVRHVSIIEPTLEDVFIHFTGRGLAA